MLLIGGLVVTIEDARAKLEAAIASGTAAERFERMIAALGGPTDFLELAAKLLPRAPVIRAVPAPAEGYVSAIATREVGLAVVLLGGGRTRADDSINPSVGFSDLLPVGAEVVRGAPLGLVHARSEGEALLGAEALGRAYRIGSTPPTVRPLIHDRFQGKDR
jgi:thymidine phosphorylase